jgi:hypothetical protein
MSLQKDNGINNFPLSALNNNFSMPTPTSSIDDLSALPDISNSHQQQFMNTFWETPEPYMMQSRRFSVDTVAGSNHVSEQQHLPSQEQLQQQRVTRSISQDWGATTFRNDMAGYSDIN